MSILLNQNDISNDITKQRLYKIIISVLSEQELDILVDTYNKTKAIIDRYPKGTNISTYIEEWIETSKPQSSILKDLYIKLPNIEKWRFGQFVCDYAIKIRQSNDQRANRRNSFSFMGSIPR